MGGRHVPFDGEFILFVGGHEGGGKAKGAQAETALRTPADVMYYGDCPLVELFLIMILVLDHVKVDEVPQIGAGIPAHVVGINIDLP